MTAKKDAIYGDFENINVSKLNPFLNENFDLRKILENISVEKFLKELVSLEFDFSQYIKNYRTVFEIYDVSLFECDLINDTFYTFDNRVFDFLGAMPKNYGDFYEKSYARCHPTSKEEFEKRFSIKNICERTDNVDDINWCVFSFSMKMSSKQDFSLVSYNIIPMYDFDGNIIRIVGAVFDSKDLDNSFNYTNATNSVLSTYDSIFYIDLKNNKSTPIKTNYSVEKLTSNHAAGLSAYADSVIFEGDRENFYKKTDLEYICKNLKSFSDTISIVYRRLVDKDKYEWYKTYVVPAVFENGIIRYVTFLAKNINEEKLVEERNQRKLNRFAKAFKAVYRAVYELRIDENIAESILGTKEVISYTYTKACRKLMTEVIDEPFVKAATEFLNAKRIKTASLDKSTIDDDTFQFRKKGSVPDKWFELQIIYLKDESPVGILITVKEITSLKTIENQFKAQKMLLEETTENKNELQLRFVMAFKNNFDFISEINLTKGTISTFEFSNNDVTLKTNEQNTKEFLAENINRIHEDDRELFLSMISKSNIENYFYNKRSSFDITFRIKNIDNYNWYYLLINIFKGESQELRFMALLRNINESENEKRHNQKILENAIVKVEDALKNEEQYRRALLSNTIFSFVVNFDKDIIESDIIDINGMSILRYLDLSVPCTYTEFGNKFIERCIIDETIDNFSMLLDKDYILNSFSNGNCQIKQEFKSITLMGKTAWFEGNILITKKSSTGELFLLFYAKDITEGKLKEINEKQRLETALSDMATALQNEEQFKRAVLHETDMAFTFDVTNDLIFDNISPRALETIKSYGLTPPCSYDKFVKEFKKQFLIDEDTDKIDKISRKYLLSVYDNNERNVSYTISTLNNGVRKWYTIYNVLTYDNINERIVSLSYSKDISSEKEKENKTKNELKKAYEEANRSYLNEMQYREALTFQASYVTKVNITKNRIIGDLVDKDGINILPKYGLENDCKYDELVQRISLIDSVENSKELSKKLVSENLLKLYEEGRRILSVDYNVTNNGVVEYGRMSFIFIKDELTDDILALVIVKDVTESVKKEIEDKNELKKAYYMANVANNAKSEFLTKISHDVRTPLNAIMGMIAITETNNDLGTYKECISDIKNASLQLLELINEILDMSKIESGKLTLSETDINLIHELNKTRKLMMVRASSKNQVFDFNFNNITHNEVIGDPLRIKQIIMNLLENAVKFTPNGGKVKMDISEIECDINNFSAFKIVVQDNGIGMSEEFIKRIYNPFEREESSTISKIEGTGLGMSIVKRIVEIMNGSIAVESKIGSGTKITVIIKLKNVKMDKLLLSDDTIGMKFAFVTNDNDFINASFKNLEAFGIEGIRFNSKDEILKALIVNPTISAVIVDSDDFYFANEIVKAIRFTNKSIKIIIASKNYNQANIVELTKNGAEKHIIKPLYLSVIKDISKLVKSKKNKVYDFTNINVLVVEDNKMNRIITNKILEQYNANVINACDGLEGYEKFKKSQEGFFDIILMDIIMPVMDGYESTKIIRELPRNDAKTVPIFAMTANAFLEDIEKSKECGMNYHVSKPINVEELLSNIDKYTQKEEN